MPPVIEQHDWVNLEHQTGDLVAQGKHGYPTVQRDLASLLQTSTNAQQRTSRLRSQDEQAAATRLLAMQGLDGGRLAQEAKTLMVPTVEDVFHADTLSTDDYLGEIQSMTILTAIQECQQETIMSFEHRNEDSLFREWSADKQYVISAVAPVSGLGDSSRAAGGLSFGTVTPNELVVFAGGAKLGAKEQSYVSAVKKLNEDNAAHPGRLSTDPITLMTAACEPFENKTMATTMSACWRLLGDIMSDARARGLNPSSDPAVYIESLIKGARIHLQQGFHRFMLNQISRNRSAAQRGADPDPLRDVQSYIMVKYKDQGPLDLVVGPGGYDTSWAQVYYSLRAGLPEVALKAAEKATDAVQARNTGATVKQLLQHWLDNPVSFRDKHGAQLVGDCERLMHSYSNKQPALKQDFQLLVCALLAGHNGSLDGLTKHNNKLLVTMEDYLWVKLSLVSTTTQGTAAAAASGGAGSSMLSAGGGQQAAGFTLSALQGELNRWDSKYYTQNGKDVLVYLTVLLLTLQFKRGLNYLLTDPLAKELRVDGLHLAIALFFTGVLECPTELSLKGTEEPDIAGQLAAFGRRYVTTDSITALQYYMLAAAVSGNDFQDQGRLFRELLVQSRDYGTLLGGGGPLGTGGAIQQFVPDQQQRQKLFAAVAYDCQMNQQPDEARELFLAAGKPLPALLIILQQLTGAIHSQQGAMTDAMATLLARGQAAVEAIQQAPSTAAMQAADAFQELQVIRELLEAAHNKHYDRALQVSQRLKFLPSEEARISSCVSSVMQLQDSVRERLTDVLLALVESVMGLKVQGQVTGQLTQQVHCLKHFVLGVGSNSNLDAVVYERVNMCAREIGV